MAVIMPVPHKHGKSTVLAFLRDVRVMHRIAIRILATWTERAICGMSFVLRQQSSVWNCGMARA
jgi:hypothetical protein